MGGIEQKENGNFHTNEHVEQTWQQRVAFEQVGQGMTSKDLHTINTKHHQTHLISSCNFVGQE